MKFAELTLSILVVALMAFLIAIGPPAMDADVTEACCIEPEAEVVTEPVEYTYEMYKEYIRCFAQDYGVDEHLAIAIWRLETSNGKSQLFKENLNFGGVKGNDGKFRKYETLADGVNSFMRTLYAYKDMTVEEMQKRYCPNSKTWSKSVKQIMKEEENAINK